MARGGVQVGRPGQSIPTERLAGVKTSVVGAKRSLKLRGWLMGIVARPLVGRTRSALRGWLGEVFSQVAPDK